MSSLSRTGPATVAADSVQLWVLFDLSPTRSHSKDKQVLLYHGKDPPNPCCGLDVSISQCRHPKTVMLTYLTVPGT